MFYSDKQNLVKVSIEHSHVGDGDPRIMLNDSVVAKLCSQNRCLVLNELSAADIEALESNGVQIQNRKLVIL